MGGIVASPSCTVVLKAAFIVAYIKTEKLWLTQKTGHTAFASIRPNASLKKICTIKHLPQQRSSINASKSKK